MLNFSRKTGVLEVISGCMFAGKTETLIRKVNVLRLAKKTVAVFKPFFDRRKSKTKTASTLVQAHSNLAIEAILVHDLSQFKAYLRTHQYDVLAFDEMQFFPPEFAYYLNQLVQTGQNVLCAGLDKGFNDQLFTTMMVLLSFADISLKLHAACFKCGNLATKTQRVDPQTRQEVAPSEIRNVVGGADVYEARCRACFKFFPDQEIYAKI